MQSNAGLCSVSPGPEGDGSFMALYDGNSSAFARMATLTITGEDSGQVNYTLTQSGANTKAIDTVSLQVKIYPNPSTGVIFLNIANSGNHAIQVVISDLLGRPVYSETFNGDVSEDPDLGKDGKGIFAVLVSSGDVVERSRIIIQ